MGCWMNFMQSIRSSIEPLERSDATLNQKRQSLMRYSGPVHLIPSTELLGLFFGDLVFPPRVGTAAVQRFRAVSDPRTYGCNAELGRL